MRGKWKALAGLLVLAGVLGAAAQNDYGTGSQALAWLKLENNARSAGMAGAGGGRWGDINSLTQNPAGLAGLKKQQLALMHQQAAGGFMVEHVAYGLGLGRGGVGVGLDYVNFGSVDSYAYDGGGQLVKSGSLNPGAYSLSLGYGHGWGSLAGGVGAKLAVEELGGTRQEGYAVDLGGRWQAHEHVGVGVALQNLGPDLNGGKLPTELRGSLLGEWNLGEGTQQGLQVGLELKTPLQESRGLTGGLGAEYRLGGRYALRGGYKLGGEAAPSGPSLGGGVGLGSLNLDYAWDLSGELGSNHRVSALLEF